MQMSYQALRDKPKTLQSLTGLNPQEFEKLLEGFGQAWGAYVEETFQRKARQRGYGAGRKAQLESLEDKLLFILVYFRLYPTQAVQGYLFGIGQVQANEWVHRLTRVLNQTLGNEQQLPERNPSKLEAVLTTCPPFPSGSTLWQDTGFQGYAPEGAKIQQPKKKPRGGELSDAEKAENQSISKIRVEVEHQIGGIKRCQIVVQKFSNRVDYYADDVIETACGLHNFRLTHRQKRTTSIAKAA